ncbi:MULTISPECIES: hypothetical protein [Bradyrhizobium]|uniref:Uncharacterized protein n=1 Tax=Bradyrhizobium elkanii TaxID=29448 RepID=A0A4U6S050_BRAEL|nr:MULTISPECIES: hypothetical protein [Bradyrhizobium]MTV16759.1 hypothetical protein [Bradyrhizobium sp. BR2003]TKV80450.1 hypothetical protein FDV58_17000 [Bradyrhizobium elkanii]
MTAKAAPPGWEPHRIETRIDGYIAARGDRIPAAVAKMIAHTARQPGDCAVAAIRERMITRHKKVFGYV